MSKRYNYLLLSLSLLLIVGGLCDCSRVVVNCCSDGINYQQNNINTPHIDSSVIDMPYVRNSYKSFGVYANCGYQFVQKHESVYLTFVNSSKDSMIFINLFKNGERRISLRNIIERNGRYCLRIINDTFHLVNIDSHVYTFFQVDDDFNLVRLYTKNLSEFIDFRNLYINSNVVIDKKISFVYPYLVLPYGHYKKRGEMDRTVCIRFNILSNEVKKILSYPAKYKKCDVQEHYPLLERTGSALAFAFLKDNSLSKVDVKENSVITKEFSEFKSSYMCYQEDLQENLSYTNKYYLNDEQNVNLISNNNFFYILKKLTRNNKNEPVRTAIIFFNDQLDFLASYFPDKALIPRFSFAWDKGIIILNDSLNRGYYYAISK